MSRCMPFMTRPFALALLIAVGACGSGDLVAPSVASGGTYTLHSFNGANLPALVSADAQNEVLLLDDAFVFQGGGSYVERGHLRTTRDGVSTVQALESPGTYARDGARVTLVSSSGTINGSFAGDSTLTILAGPNTLVFRR